MRTQLLLQSLFKKCVTDQSLATAALTERHFDTNLQLTPRSRLLLYLLRPFCFWFRLKVRRLVCTFSFQGGIAGELGKGESSENVTIFNNCKSARILFLEDENIAIQLFSVTVIVDFRTLTNWSIYLIISILESNITK